MVLWAWAITNPERAFFPRQMDLTKEGFFCSFPESLGFQEQGRRRDSEEGDPSRAEQLCLLVEPSDRERLSVCLCRQET